MSAKRVGKRIVASIAMEAILEAVRGYLEELLRHVTPEDLYRAIQQDVDPWEFTPSKVKRRGSKWARQMRKYQDRITPQLVLGWLKADRPDLHNLIINMDSTGKKWIAKRTKNIKEQLWPPEDEPIQESLEEEEAPPEEPPEQTEETPAKIRYI